MEHEEDADEASMLSESPVPLTSPEELNIFMKLHFAMIHPNGDEELIYTALDYQHPPILEFDPPLVITQDQSLISRATYNNTTNNFVNFGLLSTDEMMIVFGLVYFD